MELELDRRPRTPPTLELTPLVDVVFQLLVFFLLTTTFTLPAVPLDLPEARTGQARREEGILTLSISPGGDVFIDDAPLPLEKLDAVVTQRLRARPHEDVVIRGDIESRYGLFMRVLDACRSAGARVVLLETASKGGDPSESMDQ
jgi:biopolymer transport protein ExbD